MSETSQAKPSHPDYTAGYQAGLLGQPLQTPANADPEEWLDGYLAGDDVIRSIGRGDFDEVIF